ncbi:MAG: prepilin peptidase [Burkholderiaceae bacterium]|nr:prepilin peptidase [Burkholderiaceae bacterium]
MLFDLTHVLPVPGPVWGRYPTRPSDDRAPPWRRLRWRGALARSRRVAQAAVAHAQTWRLLDAPARAAALLALRRRLRRAGLQHDAVAQGLGFASACAAETLGWTPRETQRLAAAALLDSRMAEMATGEGKTLAIGLAAAVAALAGVPVHVVTANDYLAARDAQSLAPLFCALGLRAAALAGAGSDQAKRAVYAHDIVYATAKELAFDFLRDRQAMGPASELERLAADVVGPAPPPLMRGLCMALLDEADSILLDEAEVPLILSRAVPQAARRAFLWQALALARQLDAGRDFVLHSVDRMATLTAAGEDRLAALAAGLGGPWQRQRYRREAIHIALAGLHAYRRNEHYLVREERIDLLDEVTGRVAAGRVWSRGLQTIVALKEGLSAPDETETVAQTTFQRFFQRYWRLCGISGTLWEARGELSEVYGARVVRIPLHRPCRRQVLPPRRFETMAAMLAPVVARVASLHAAGRPVLVGTDSVADSQRLSQQLRCAGIEHRVLNALNDAEEAAIVAEAGRAGRVTVATRMAGRGTDIELDAAARTAGGLHVLSLQDNASRRLDRQLAGRAGRHGDPGSVEAWHTPCNSAHVSSARADKLTVWTYFISTKRLSGARRQWGQSRQDRRRAALRRDLLQQDLHWERRLSFAGPPP